MKTDRLPSYVPIVVILLIVVLGLVALRSMARSFISNSLKGSSAEVDSDIVSQSVAQSLMEWGIFGPVPTSNPAYDNLILSIARRIQGIHGFTESDGFHGDGADWYEVEFTPDLANELRAALKNSDIKKAIEETSLNFSKSPDWWPKKWPADVKAYERYNLEYLVLPDNDTHAWFLRVRM